MLAAFALSSRVLVLLALLSFGTAWALAALLGIPIWPAVGCAGVLAAVMLGGGLYARRTGLLALAVGCLGVAPGNWVALGQPLARCGSSGRSPQPHLHTHVQDGPWLGAPTRPGPST